MFGELLFEQKCTVVVATPNLVAAKNDFPRSHLHHVQYYVTDYIPAAQTYVNTFLSDSSPANKDTRLPHPILKALLIIVDYLVWLYFIKALLTCYHAYFVPHIIHVYTCSWKKTPRWHQSYRLRFNAKTQRSEPFRYVLTVVMKHS